LILKLIYGIVNPEMGKKRKTRQQKIILQLKRKLAAQSAKEILQKAKTPVRQEVISYRSLTQSQTNLPEKKQEIIAFSYDPRLVKKDLLKTLILALVIIGFQLVLYLKLR
jgi:hypothetical protein